MLIGIDASRANRIKKTGTEWYSYYLIQEMKKLESGESRFVLYSREPLRGELAELPAAWSSKVLAWPPRKLWTQLRLSYELVRHCPDKLFVPAHTIPLIHPPDTITTLHDIGFEKFPKLYSAAELIYHRFSAKLAIKKARHIITVSHFSKQEMVEIYGAPPQKISVVYNGYNDRIYRRLNEKTTNEILTEQQIKKPYLLFVGRLEEKKNIKRLVQAFAILKKKLKLKPYDLNLVLAGRPGFGYNKIREEIEKNDLADSVIEPGWLGEEKLPALYNGAEVFVFPSLYEGFGIPLLEAMACGTPVVTSKITSLPEIAAGAGLLVNPENPEDIAEAIEKILNDKNLKSELISKGLERVKNFSWEKCACETLEVIREQ